MAPAKRKRDEKDQGERQTPPQQDFIALLRANGETTDSEIAQALQQHNAGQINVPQGQSGEDSRQEDPLSTASAALNYSVDPQGHDANFGSADDHPQAQEEPTFDIDSPNPQQGNNGPYPAYANFTPASQDPGAPQHSEDPRSAAQDPNVTQDNLSPTPPGGIPTAAASTTPGGGRANKPKVGTDEWHASRRSAHKDVERRRRETINEGINELAKIVPGAERNKGSILNRAVQYILELRGKQETMENKGNLEKMMFEQTMNETNAALDRLKGDNSRLREENERLKREAAAR